MPHWTDAHNHLQDSRLGDSARLVAVMKASGVTRSIVNSTGEEDWNDVKNLAEIDPDLILPAYGIHPWRAHETRSGWIDRLREILTNDPNASIGECGLDGWTEKPSLEVQRPVFLEQLQLARELDRPMTIHCLKAWQPLFECFAESPPPSRFLMHSFGGSLEIARRLIPMGAYFSFSGHFLHPRKSSVLEVFRALPVDRILLETDAPDMLPPPDFISHFLPGNQNHPANLPAIGAALAAVLGISPTALAEATRANTRTCFGV